MMSDAEPAHGVDQVGHRIDEDDRPQAARQPDDRVERARQKEHRLDDEVHHRAEPLERLHARGDDDPQRVDGHPEDRQQRQRGQRAERAEPRPHQRRQQQHERHLDERGGAAGQDLGGHDRAARNRRHQQLLQEIRTRAPRRWRWRRTCWRRGPSWRPAPAPGTRRSRSPRSASAPRRAGRTRRPAARETGASGW